MNVKCPQCEGKGEYNYESSFQGEKLVYPVKCTICEGTGKVPKSYILIGKTGRR